MDAGGEVVVAIDFGLDVMIETAGAQAAEEKRELMNEEVAPIEAYTYHNPCCARNCEASQIVDGSIADPDCDRRLSRCSREYSSTLSCRIRWASVRTSCLQASPYPGCHDPRSNSRRRATPTAAEEKEEEERA